MIVRTRLLTPVRQQHAAGHAQMDHQHHAVIQAQQQILGAPVDRLDGPADQAVRQIIGQRIAQIGPPLFDGGEPLAKDSGRQATADGFDFGQFGHCVAAYSKKRGPALWSRP